MENDKITRWHAVQWGIVLTILIFGMSLFILTAPVLILGFIIFSYIAIFFSGVILITASKYRKEINDWMSVEL
jgi:hypothetical protein